MQAKRGQQAQRRRNSQRRGSSAGTTATRRWEKDVLVHNYNEDVRTAADNQCEEDITDSNSDTGWQQDRHQRRRERRRMLGERNRDVRSRRPAVIGTRNSANLTAARPLRDISLFVTRLAPDVDGEVLRAHVEELVGEEGSTTCELQPQRHPSYRSFKVIIKGMMKEHIVNLYDPGNWDKDILVKRWFD